jgi:hypothetical protein
MANYLQRVAAAGMRTTMAAKPPVAGPPILPGYGFSDLASASGMERSESRDIQRGTMQAGPLLPAASTAMNIPISSQRADHPPFQGQFPPTSSTMPTIRVSKVTGEQRTLSSALPQVNQPGRANTPHGSSAPSTNTIIPPSREPHRREPTSAAPAPPSPSDPPSLPGRPRLRELVQEADKPSMHVTTRVARLRESIEDNTRSSATTAFQVSQPNTSPFGKGVSGRVSQAQPAQNVVPQMSAPVMPPSTPPSRQVKLTIGRLDVQVHNQPSAPAVRRPMPAASTPVTHTLEQHYVDRFRLKP